MKSLLEIRIDDYLARSKNESSIVGLIENQKSDISIILAEGFEERSTGIIEEMVRRGMVAKEVIIGRYATDTEHNKRYRERIENAAKLLSKGNWKVIDNYNDGIWIKDALELVSSKNVLIDITSISNRGLFCVLDSCRNYPNKVYIGYSEANHYYPRKSDWNCLLKDLRGKNVKVIADLIDDRPWLFGLNHQVQFIPNHEGYDSANSGCALISFLPFKHARLATVLAEANYSDFLFIAGKPRLQINKWRLKAQKDINSPLLLGRRCIEMNTFSYRNALNELRHILFAEDSFFFKSDVHLCILGSKLQTFACWALSCIIPSLTIVTSVPKEYYPDAFSEGIGKSWYFSFIEPYMLENK